MKIFKYEVGESNQPVMMHAGAKILHVAQQKDKVMAWALVDPKEPIRDSGLTIFMTGDTVEIDLSLRFVNTFMIGGGEFVFHAFQRYL